MVFQKKFLHVISKPFNFIQTEIHIFLANLRRQNNHAEKIDFVFQRLVADHHAAFFHHPLFDGWSHLGRDEWKVLNSVPKWHLKMVTSKGLKPG